MPVNTTLTERSHRLQLYGADARALVSSVGDYICEGIDKGDGILVIATAEHRLAFEATLRTRFSRATVAGAFKDSQILFIEAGALLSRLMVNGELDWVHFEPIVSSILDEVHPRKPGASRRCFGEMVGLLWKAGEFAAAVRLEELWNRALRSGRFQLFCAYPIDVFSPEFHNNPSIEPVLRSHTHLMSFGDSTAICAAIDRAVLEARVESDLPQGAEAEAKILWLRRNHPVDADEILSKARHHYHNENRFRALIENSSDAVMLVDPQGSILYASSSTTRIVGYKPEEITARNSADFIHPSDRREVFRKMNTILRRPRSPISIQFRVLCRNGSWCWIEATGSNLLDEADISAIVFNYRDITNRIEAENALRRSETALRNANAGLEQFANAAAHDLQEPIRNVAIYVEFLASRYGGKLNAEANDFIRVVVEGASRIRSLTEDLVAFTRSLDEPPSPSGEPGSKPSADGGKVIEEVVANLAPAIDRNRAIITWDALPVLPMHYAHLLQVLRNLIDNALKFRSEQVPRIHISAEPQKQEWLVGVMDNGIGVPVEYQEQIFGVFKRLHGRDVPGNGIGLAICSRIVTHYRGSIEVRQRPGGGSIFLFRLPRAGM